MSIGIVIATHGLSSVELLKSAEMIAGKQKDVETVTFEEGEGLEELANNYTCALKKLIHTDNIIILVDLLGGSPFNVAADQNCEVITGVNIPMLLELFVNRENIEADVLVNKLVLATKESINTLSNVVNVSAEDESF